MKNLENLRNLKVMMSYRGTAYHGFQIQENSRTVQEVVEQCVGKVLNESVTIQGCSRTDTGVHARQFCFSVQTNSKIPVKGFVRGVNGELPPDISILSCEETDPDFHARFSCKGKEYVYVIHNSESKDPFMQDLAYHYRRKFDLELVRDTAEYFIGTKDFRAFCTDNGRKNVDTVRTVRHFTVHREGEKIYFTIQGDGFLYHMVRIIVGTLIDVNEKKILPEQMAQIFASGDRLQAGRTAPAQGLYLNQVFY